MPEPPSSQITTSAKVRWMSIPITRLTISSLPIEEKGAGGDTTTTDSRSQRNRASRRGGQLQTRARSSSYKIGLPALRAPGASVPDGRTIRLVHDERSRTSAPDIFLPVTNPIESVFATVRHSTVRTKGSLSSATAKLMVFKLIMAASKTWQRLNGEKQLPKVVEGVKFQDGIEIIERPSYNAA